jgi:membrane associated rhomboid family serine protease
MSPRGQQMGGFSVPPLTRGVKVLGIATLVLSIGSKLGHQGELLGALLAFSPESLLHFRLWTPFTYTFVNPEPFNLIFSLLGLWFCGSMLEQRWRTRRFVIFYFLVGALAALATFLVSFIVPSVRSFPYFGNYAAIEGMVAAVAILAPDATFLLYIMPVRARMMLPIAAGMTLLFMVMGTWQAYLPQLFGLGAGVLLAGGVSPSHFWLRARVWWIDRRLRRSKLRIVRGVGSDEKSGARGSDKYLH